LWTELDILLCLSEKSIHKDPNEHQKIKILTAEMLQIFIAHSFVIQTDILLLQKLIELSFEFALLDKTLKAVDFLIKIERFIQLIMEFSIFYKEIKLKAQATFYNFKRYQLIAGTYGVIYDQTKEILYRKNQKEYLVFSAALWKDLEGFDYYGSNNGLYNPYEEIINILNTLGALNCIDEKFIEGINYLETAKNYFLVYESESSIKKFDSKLNNIPSSLIISYFHTLKNAAVCSLSLNKKDSALSYLNSIITVFYKYEDKISNSFDINYVIDYIKDIKTDSKSKNSKIKDTIYTEKVNQEEVKKNIYKKRRKKFAEL